MDLPHDPMLHGLTSPIRRRRIRPLVHAPHTPQRAANAHKLGALTALLQQRQRGLEEIQRAEAVDLDVFPDSRGVGGGEGGHVGADAGVGDDEVEGVDVLGGEVGDGGGGVGGGFGVDFHHHEFAGGVFGEGRELLGGGVGGVADGGYDCGGGAGEVGFHEAEADAWVGL